MEQQLKPRLSDILKLVKMKDRLDAAVENWKDLMEWYERFPYLRVNRRLFLPENDVEQENNYADLFWIEECLLLEQPGPHKSLSEEPFTPDLPKIFVKIHNVLLSGHFLRVMPDISRCKSTELTCHIFKSLKNDNQIDSNTTLLVLSIIGLHSTGKSTLLNSIFGVEFLVDLGGCTKGICAHMIPTTNEKFKYILIFDTEGLIDSETRWNNQLAEIIMDLSDVIIINVKGENTSEKSRKLQTLVHTCAKLKQHNNNQILQKTCLFAYQNMPKTTTQNVFVRGKSHLSTSLNNLTKSITCYRDFHDMIGFDHDKNVFYFSDFWCGCPTTSTVNVDYIECAQKLKRFIIEEADRHPNVLSTLGSICQRLDGYKREETQF